MNKSFTAANPNVINIIKKNELFEKIPDERILLMLEKTSTFDILDQDILFTEGEAYHKGIYYILDGDITLKNTDNEHTLLSNGDIIGLTTFVGKSAYSFTAKAEKDTKLLYFPEICIYKLMADSEYFRKQFYHITLERLNFTTEDNKLSLSSHTYKAVGSHMTSPIITFNENLSIPEASILMSDHKIGGLVITNDDNELTGLLTTKHIVHNYIPKVANQEEDITTKDIMDSTPSIVPKEFPLIEVLSEMQSKNKDYAIIVKDLNNPIGIISNKDIMRTIYQTSSTMSFHVDHTTDLNELQHAKKILHKTAKNLVNNSRLTSEVLKTISSLHLSIQKQVFQISVNHYQNGIEFNISNVDYCLIIMGSGARQEMMLDPDQDNGFIFGNDITEEQQDHMMKIGAIFCDNLEFVGYEKCPGNIMTTNPDMSKTLKEWKQSVYGMINNPKEIGLLWSSIIFDMEGFSGNESLIWELKSYILKSASVNDVFLLQLYENESNYTVPLSIFGKFTTIKDGEHKGMMDLKTSAISFIVFIARLNSLKAGINDTNTIDRLKHLKRIKVLDNELVDNILSAYETITDITFRKQIQKAENNKPLNKIINPKELSLYNQQKLKDAFGEISKFLNSAKRKFKRA